MLSALGWSLLASVEARCRFSDDCVGEAWAWRPGSIVVTPPMADGPSLVAIVAREGRLAPRPMPQGVDPQRVAQAL